MNPTKLFSEALFQNKIFSRFYYTNRVKKDTLYSRISPLGDPNKSIVPELEDWIRYGYRISVGELQRVLRDLRKRKRFNQALEVSQWMQKKGICTFTPTEHAVQVDLIGRVHGFLSAESYFNNLKDEDKTIRTFGALLHCYVRQLQIGKSLSLVQKMKELGLASSAVTYNNIMSLYTNIGQHEKVPGVLTEMKEKGVSPNNLSYRICVNSYGARPDVEGMERVLKEMESQPHIVMDWSTYAAVANFYIKEGLCSKAIDALEEAEAKLQNKDGTGHNHLISLYAKLGKKDQVLRIWALIKKDCKRYINRDFITMLESLVRLGELKEAEKLLKDWELSCYQYDFRVPNTVIIGYSEKGLYEKAEAMLEEFMRKGNATTPNSWAKVAAGYLDAGQAKKALACMKNALSIRMEKKGWKPNPRVITGILSCLGDEGSIEDVVGFVDSLRTAIPVSREMYNALLRASIRCGRNVDKLLDSMRVDKIDENEETRSILSTLKNED